MSNPSSMETERAPAVGVAVNPPTMPGNDIPTLAWRDDILSCCRHGPCHPFCCLAYWCPFVALGQLLARMKLTFLAQPASSPLEAERSFYYNVYLTVGFVFWGCCGSLIVLVIAFATESDEDASPFASFLDIFTRLLSVIAALYLIIASCTLRRQVRNRFRIPATSCPEPCDDICCIWLCGPCSLCQIARHTVNYDVVPAACCSPTGLPASHPALVV